MKSPIENKINNWERTVDNKYRDINLRILYLSNKLFQDYEPSSGPGPGFMDRLNNWLENIDNEEEQRTLFETIPNLFYVGREEFNALYREAYNIIYGRWLIDQISFKPFEANERDTLDKAILETWFCPLTDSLRINQFYHVNNIPSKQDYRPDWRSLVKFGSEKKLNAYIKEHKIKRIVLLEDFIGNGGQVSKAVEFAAKSFPSIPLIVIPLLLCPEGEKNAKKLALKYENVTIRPVVSIPLSSFITPNKVKTEQEIYTKIRELIIKNYKLVSAGVEADDKIDPYGPFGWRETGALIVMFSNTPNNSLPIIHNESKTWTPLFKRHKRI